VRSVNRHEGSLPECLTRKAIAANLCLGGFVEGLFTLGVGMGACGQLAEPAPDPAVVLQPVFGFGVVVLGVVPGVVEFGVAVVFGVALGAVVSGIVPGGVTPGVTVPGGIC
jgi:hypothetical protein